MKGVTMDVVLNEKIVCHDAVGLINACEMMRVVNSTKVRADVLYLNRKGYPCRRYRPCVIEFWHFGDSQSFNVYGDGFVAEWCALELDFFYNGTEVNVGWYDYDTPRSGAVSYL